MKRVTYKVQNDFFKIQYDEENIRNEVLTRKAEIYFSIISIFFTGILFKVKDIFESAKNLDYKFLIILLCFALISLSIALILITYSLKIRTYEGVINIEDFIKKNDENNQDEDDFFRDRVADYIVAIRRNEIVNDEKSSLLIKSSLFILIGLLLSVLFIITLLILKA